MPFLVAHRGNTEGPNSYLENDPVYVEKAISKGFFAEVDIWKVGPDFFLGHDQPEYEIPFRWLSKSNKVIFHAKNYEALSSLLVYKFHCFWHETDRLTVTSKGYIWSLPYPLINLMVSSQSIIMSYGSDMLPKSSFLNAGGICSDNVAHLKAEINV